MRGRCGLGNPGRPLKHEDPRAVSLEGTGPVVVQPGTLPRAMVASIDVGEGRLPSSVLRLESPRARPDGDWVAARLGTSNVNRRPFAGLI